MLPVAVSRAQESVWSWTRIGRERKVPPYGAVIDAKDGAAVKAARLSRSGDPYTHPIVSEVAGVNCFVDSRTASRFTGEIDEPHGPRQRGRHRSEASRQRRQGPASDGASLT